MYGSRVEHEGQHGPNCFACKLKTIRFSSMQPPRNNQDDPWKNDPVKQRIEEIHGIEIDTDHMNKRRVDALKE